MKEFIGPYFKERQLEHALDASCDKYGLPPLKRRVSETALERLTDDKSLRRAVLNSEKMLFYLSLVSTQVDKSVFENLFTPPYSIYDFDSVFISRLKGWKTSGDAPALSNVSEDETEIQIERMGEWHDRSLLRGTREKFGITPENEKEYKVSVLNYRINEFRSEIGVGACVFWGDHTKPSTIILPIDSEDNDVVHEYIHSQIMLFPGYLDLGRGFEEGFVESNTPSSSGNVYVEQRRLFSYIETVIPETNVMLCRSRNNPDARTDFFRAVVREFGLSGLNYILRASPDPTKSAKKFYRPEMYDYMLDPDEVLEALSTIQRVQSATMAAR